MKHPRTIAALLTLLVLYGCVELTGQRFTWFHDVLKDTFYVLIQYDGIHERSGSGDKGKDQIPEFIKNGDIMVVDWFFYLQRKQLGHGKESEDPLKAAVITLLDRMKVEILGRYREPDGRVGAAQLVTIEKFMDFLKEGNRLISASLARLDRETVVAQAKKRGELWRTLDRILLAAKTDHTWIVARGHSLCVTVPVHQDEWAEAKGAKCANTVQKLMEELVKVRKADVKRFVRSLASSAFSYSESGDMVTLALGNAAAPRTIQVQIRSRYNDQLETVVAENVKVDLDQQLLRRIQKDAREGIQEDDALRKVRHWLPPEVEIGALLAAAKVQTAVDRDQVIKHLHALGDRWNQNGGHPEAPMAKGMSQDAYLASWHEWYSRRRRFTGNPKW